jgi:lysyl endopeptidase
LITKNSCVYLLVLIIVGTHSRAQTGRKNKSMDASVHRAERQLDISREESAQAIRGMKRPSRKVTLRALTEEESRPVSRKPGLTAIGVSRALPNDIVTQGEWSITSDSRRVWRISVESTGAETLRVKFANFDVGDGSVWLLGTDTEGAVATSGPYTKRGPQDNGDFWSDLVPGQSVIIAYEPPMESASTEVPFRLVEVSHLFSKAREKSTQLAAAASCALDVTCFPEYSEPASAVAFMIFESEGRSYNCTGALVSSGAQPAVPLFLTANHCIGTEAEAKSLIAIFNYQTSTCNGSVPSLSSLPRVRGATILEGQPMASGDFTLLQLSGFPNVDVKVLGWYADEIGRSEQVTGISHPVGDYKRIAVGQRTRDVTIRFTDGDEMPADKGIQVTWFQGVTQSGSSGSPLLAEINGNRYVVGTLSAGPDVDEDNDRQVCRSRNLNASYGRFSAAFPLLERFLTGTGGAVVSGSSDRQATLSATPNPVRSAGSALGTTTLSWRATGVSQVQVRVLSPTGPPMTGIEAPSGAAATGNWVSDGMLFYLQDASDGDSSGAAKTLATVRVDLT